MGNKIYTIDLTNALARRYSLRQARGSGDFWEITVPKEVVKREARRLDISVQELKAKFELECLFDDFQGLHYRFVEKEE